MLSRRIPYMDHVPEDVRAVFLNPDPSKCTRTIMFREAVARVVLDALGFTGISGKANVREHNTAVSDARNWFKHDNFITVYDGEPELRQSEQLFDLAGIHDYHRVRDAILACTPKYMEDTST